MLRISSLQTDYCRNPEGVGARPHFGWILESERKNVRQAAFRFRLAEDPAFAAVVFDSGEISSGESAHYVPADLPLCSARRYYWQVSVRDDSGEESGWSETATFVTALLDKKEWKAAFLTAETDADADDSRGTRLFTTIRIPKPVRAAYAFSTALGVYHLFLDGEKVGCDQMTPGWTAYQSRLLYQTYDITGLLTPGEHELAGMVGPGWYKGEMGYLHNRNNFGRQTAFACQLEIDYEDGTHETLGTDAAWQAEDTCVRYAEIYHGETCDAGFADFNRRPAAVFDYPAGNLEPQGGCRVKIQETIPVKEIIRTPKGETVLDFGQNLTGFVRLTVQGKAGDAVAYQCFEVLDRDGNVYTENLRAAKQKMRYILRGGEPETWQPLFTFQGFRYIHLTEYPGEPRAEDFEAQVVYSDMEFTSEFETSDPLLNQLYHNILWSLKGNFLDLPTDCPQRDERLGWTGDCQIFTPTACFLVNAYPFFQKWLRDLIIDQKPDGGVPFVVPDILSDAPNRNENGILEEGTYGATAWGDVAVLNPWNLYLSYGDRRILEDQYDSMRAWIDFMRDHTIDGGPVWRFRSQFGDWVALDAEEGSYFGATPNDYSCAAYFCYSTGVFAKIAGLLGRKADCETYTKLYRDMTEGFRRTFFREDGSLTVDTQTAHIIALRFGLVPEQWHEKTVRRLTELLAKENGHLVTGFIGTPYFTFALSDNGRLDLAYDLLLKDDFPSWLYQVRMGATTVWEHWDGIRPDGSMWSAEMNSFNHYSYGSIGKWLFSVMGGIDADESCPGYRRVKLAPRIGGGLTKVRTKYRSVYGDVISKWETGEQGITFTFTVPCNAEAVIDLSPYQVTDADGLRFRDGCAAAGSGTYTIYCR